MSARGAHVAVEHVSVTFDGTPVLVRQPELNFINDKAGKPVGIHMHIGRRPIAAFGNSDRDLQMLQWTAAGDGARFMLLVHHTDADADTKRDNRQRCDFYTDANHGHQCLAEQRRQRQWQNDTKNGTPRAERQEYEETHNTIDHTPFLFAFCR